ncbi:TPA: hypothetical protein HA235_00790 [Candidatus Woesearchaeota archaeon]|nr:hypothetical protein [Candidatus Woesearchaeota archaeon]HIH31221.1 hypothetical protein [Candidatus Woesearchaeota archaeon]HIH54835.1 hypothetical protein [Candidatus Woesearchaeota archaeon]HIJ01626.1 hypothetical protein [Candidatus Woesearchaeota archaeon]HIJ14046.1 hypothetical protein [Candidatus Woesearchaeota archaeon]
MSKKNKPDKSIDKSVKSNIQAVQSKIKNYQELLKEYHITDDHVTPKVILDKINEHLEYYIKILIQILQPEEFHSLHECTIFDDAEKAKIFEFYKNMMILHRELVKTHIKNTENDLITTIQYAHTEMKNYKPEMLKIIQKMQDSWKKQASNGRMKYFG